MDDDMQQGSNPQKNNISKFMIDLNKRELEKFFNLDKKTKIVLTGTTLAILLFVSIGYFAPFKNKTFESVFPKEASKASQTGQTAVYKSPVFKFEIQYPKMYYLLSEYNPNAIKMPLGHIDKEGYRSRFALTYCPAEESGCPQSQNMIVVEVFENLANWSPKQWFANSEYAFINNDCDLKTAKIDQSAAQFLGRDALSIEAECNTQALIFKEGQKIFVLGVINEDPAKNDELKSIRDSFKFTN